MRIYVYRLILVDIATDIDVDIDFDMCISYSPKASFYVGTLRTRRTAKVVLYSIS